MKRPAPLLCASLLVMACASSSAPTSTGTTAAPASAIPPELAPLFAKPVALSVFC